jgi:hypothetical protein
MVVNRAPRLIIQPTVCLCNKRRTTMRREGRSLLGYKHLMTKWQRINMTIVMLIYFALVIYGIWNYEEGGHHGH